MCMVDGADGCNEFSRTTHHTARKEHKCAECHRAIEPGERYTYDSWKYDGDFASSKRCAHCNVSAQWLRENCGGFLIYGIYEDIQEHVSEYRGDAICVPRLKRLEIGMQRRWKIRRGPKKGQLMPIPQLPAKLEPKHAH
jgi:hypothetical protein